jgi:hypothetical protein
LSEFMSATPEKDDNFNVSTVWWYVKNTGIPISFGTTVIIGLLVGMAVSCQTFYSFVLENMRHLGALKAMGASSGTLCLMLIVQAFTVGIIGYGIGLLGTAGFALGALKNEQPPFYMPEFVPFAVLGGRFGHLHARRPDGHLAREPPGACDGVSHLTAPGMSGDASKLMRLKAWPCSSHHRGKSSPSALLPAR